MLDIWWCWQRRVRHENWVRVNGVKGKIWGGKPAEGAVLPQRPCGLQWTPHKCLKQEGTKEVGNPVVHAFVQILNICRVIAGCKLLHQEWETATRRQTVLMVKHLHKSHPMWICLSLWEKKGGSKPNREGRTERMYWELIMWFLFFSPFYIAAQWLHVCSWGLLANFSNPSQLMVSLSLSLSFFSCVFQQLVFLLLFFLHGCVTCESSCSVA